MKYQNPKKLIVGSGLTAALLGTFLLGGVTLNHASAAPPATPGTPTTIVQGEQPNANEANEPAPDPTQVKITADQARAAALAKFPGATVKQVELQDENGALVWGVALTDASGQAQDVKVDGNSGQLVSTQADGTEGAGAPEAPGAAETGD